MDTPTFVLTANPDRLTRRADEVKPLVDMLKATGGAWLSRGILDEAGVKSGRTLETNRRTFAGNLNWVGNAHFSKISIRTAGKQPCARSWPLRARDQTASKS